MSKGKYQKWITEEGLLKIGGWARDGLTEEQIAQKMGISRSTLNEWKKKYSDISDALKKGKEIIDRQVENALLKNALGYTYTEQQGFKLKRVYYDKDGRRCEEERLEMIEVKRHKPAETIAQIFWLKNRKPAEWRDKRDIEHSGGIETTNPFAGLTTEELRKLINDG